MTTFEASTVIYDEIRSTLFEIDDNNSSIGLMTSGAGNRSGNYEGFCSPFGFQFFVNTIFIGLLCIFGLAGNTISILVLQKDRHNRVPVFLLQSLAIADNSVLCIGFLALSLFYGTSNIVTNDSRFLSFRHFVLKYINPLGNIALSVGTWLTVLLAVNRYVAICRPFKAKRWLTMAYARVQVALVVTFCVLLNAPMVLRFGDSPCANSSSNCSDVQLSALAKEKWFGLYYLNVFYVPTVYILPLVFLAGLNVPIIRQVQKSRLRMKRNSLSYSGRQETNITIVLVVIVLEMIFCHTPDRIVQVIRACDVIFNGRVDIPRCPDSMFIVQNMTNLFVMANASTNFIVYYVLRKRFRRILGQKLCCGRGSNPAGPDQSPLPSTANGGSLCHSHSHHKHHHHHHCCHKYRHRKSSAEEDVKATTLIDRYRLTKKRDSKQICLLKVNNTCM